MRVPGSAVIARKRQEAPGKCQEALSIASKCQALVLSDPEVPFRVNSVNNHSPLEVMVIASLEARVFCGFTPVLPHVDVRALLGHGLLRGLPPFLEGLTPYTVWTQCSFGGPQVLHLICPRQECVGGRVPFSPFPPPEPLGSPGPFLEEKAGYAVISASESRER